LDTGEVRLETPDGVTVLFTDVFLDVLFKDDDWVGVLFGPARWALV